MEQRTVLLNGGRELDVAPVPGADEFIAGLLNGAPARPIVPTLRVVKVTGRPAIAVLIGGRHVGFLPRAVDEDVLLTVAACDLHGVKARARGHLVASSENGHKAAVKVSLAEPEFLLRGPQRGASVPKAQEPAARLFEPTQASHVTQSEVRGEPGGLAGSPRPGWFIAAGELLPAQEPPAPPFAAAATAAMATTDAGAMAGGQAATVTAASRLEPSGESSLGVSPEPSEEAVPEALPDRQTVDCPNCGYSWPRGTPRCNCGCWLGNGQAISDEGKIVGNPPIVLSGSCVDCGKTSVNGRRIEKTIYYFPAWIWLTAICLMPLTPLITSLFPASEWLGVFLVPLGLVVALIIYYILRKRVEVSYSLCPHCAASRKSKKWMAGAIWLVFAVLGLLTILVLWERPGGVYFAVAAILLFFFALAASVFASLPIRATARRGRLFTLGGACRDFLATMARTG